jgi:hypothetical protein
MTSILLSDDEVVAAAASRAVRWPIPLATVRMNAGELGAAVLRGRRSLAIRDLVVAGGATVDVVSEPIVAAAEAPARWYAYTASSQTLTVPSGSATYAFVSGDSAVVDMVSGAGVHRFSAAPASDTADLIVALARNVFEHGFRGGAAGGVLVVGATTSETWALVAAGRIDTGAFGSEGFESAGSSAVWDASVVHGVLAP